MSDFERDVLDQLKNLAVGQGVTNEHLRALNGSVARNTLEIAANQADVETLKARADAEVAVKAALREAGMRWEARVAPIAEKIAYIALVALLVYGQRLVALFHLQAP